MKRITLMILSLTVLVNAQNVTVTVDDVTGTFNVRNDKPDTLMVIDGKTGNVGIGINNPQERLHIVGDLLVVDLKNNHRGANIMIADEDSNMFTFFVQDTVGYLKTTNEYMDLVLGAGAWGDHLSIKASGNIGIGTMSPTEKLDVVGNIAVSGTVDGIDISAEFAANTAKVTNATHTGDVTGATALTIGADKVLESHLKVVNTPTDEYALTYESTTGDFEWQAMSSGSDDQKVDIFSISGNNVQLSLEDDGEAAKTVDISNTTAVAANTAKVTNATHTGDVTGATALTIQDNSVDGTDIALGSDTAGDIMFYDGTDWIRLATGTAGQLLKVNSGATAPEWETAAGWSLAGNTGTDPATDFLGTTDAQDFVLRTNNTEKMRIASGGNVGIGADTPAEKLEVNGNLLVNDGIYSKDDILYLEAASGNYVEVKSTHANYGLIVREYNSNDWGNIVVTSDGLELGYKTTSTTVTIDNSGYFYARRIAVNLSSAPTYGVQIYTSGTVSNSEKGYAGAWVTASDGRFKANKTDVLNGLDKVLLMKPIYYQWTETITDNETGKISVGELLPNSSVTIGFVAQDMINIVPEVVGKPEDETKEKWGIEYSKLTPVIVSAIQEQQKLIENLQQENSNLKAEVSKVKALEERQVEFEAKIMELMETIKRNDER